PAIMDKPYNEVSNPENTFFSSRLSFLVLLNASANYRLNELTNLRLAASFNHISNGGIKNPNRGINFPTMNVGVDYNLRPQPFLKRTKNDTIDLHPDKWRLDILLFGTGKTDIKGHAHYPVFGLSGSVSRVVTRLGAVSLGLEGTVDLADKEEIERLELTENGEYLDHKYCAGLLGYELLIGKFIFSIHAGAYFYSPYKRMDPVYERYGLSYHFNKRIFIGTNIKAHRHVADFLDFRAGISL
ncbi:MAG: acyloxyacyl hydrolase, partial [Bacteroidales bacterium]